MAQKINHFLDKYREVTVNLILGLSIKIPTQKRIQKKNPPISEKSFIRNILYLNQNTSILHQNEISTLNNHLHPRLQRRMK